MPRFSLAALLLLTASPIFAAPPPVTAVAYRDDGKLLAAGTRGTVQLVDPAKGEVVGELPGQTSRVTGLAFSKAGLLAVASGDAGKSGIVRLYDLAAGKGTPTKPLAEISAHKDAIYAIAFAPDGQTLATAGYDRLIHLWDVPPKSEPRRTLKDHSDSVYSLAFHRDGKLLASGAADRAVKVWDITSGKRLYTLSDPTDWVYAVTWSPDGKHLAAGGVDKSIRIWTADAEGGKLVNSAFAHESAVTRLMFPKDGSSLVSVGEDRVVKVWNPAKLVESRVFPAQPDTILAADLRPDGKLLAVGRFDGVLQLLDSAGKLVSAPLPAKPKPPTVTKVTPDAATRGTTTRLTISGTGLDRVTGIKPIPGVRAKVLESERARNRLDLEVTVSEDAPVGAESLVLTSDAGDTAPSRLWIDRFPAVAETGNTDSARAAMRIAPPTTVVGMLDRAGDADFFRFDAKAGDPVGVQLVTGVERKDFDPVLLLVDDSGEVLAEGSTTLGYVFPKAGTYAVGVRDREYRGGKLGYRLQVGPVPVVTGIFPLGVSRGKETDIRIVGVNLDGTRELSATVHPPADVAPGTRIPVKLRMPMSDLVGVRPEVVVGEFPATLVTRDSATLPAVPGTADGLLERPGAVHTIRFSAKKGHRLIVETHAARLGSPVDSAIEIIDSTGKPVPRATLRTVAKTYTTLRDHGSTNPGIRIETWNELAVDDLLFCDGDLMRIRALPRNPDDDCQFYQESGKRLGFLDSTPKQHAMGVPFYKVEVHPPEAKFPPNGMPVFRVAYRNDDGGPGYDKDSRVFFDPPADGTYAVRVTDATGAGGPAHAYRVTVRPPQPDFAVRFSPGDPKVWRGGGVPISVTATRIDGYDGPINLEFADLPRPFSAPKSSIEPGQTTTALTLSAGESASTGKFPTLKLVGSAVIDGKKIVHESTGGNPTLLEPGDLATATNLSEVSLKPGGEARLIVKIQRRNGFQGRVPLDVRGLPHGVRVLNIGLNGILINANESEREIVLFADEWVKPIDHPIVVLSRVEKKGTEHAAPSVLLRVK